MRQREGAGVDLVMTTVRWAALVALAAIAAGCGDEGTCDLGELQAELDAASPGETVRIGECRIAGAVRVPAGVTLAGAGPSRSVLVSDGTRFEGVGVDLVPSASGPRTAVRGLAVESRGRLAIHARGAGVVTIADVDVRVHQGVGVGADGVGSVVLERVAIAGQVTAATASDPAFLEVAGRLPPEDAACAVPEGCSCTVGERRPVTCDACGATEQVCDTSGRWATLTSTEGLILVGVAEASILDTTAGGFARYGVVTIDSTVAMRGGGADANLGVGMYASGGAVTLDGVSICRTLQGVRGSPSFGGIFTGNVAVTSTGTTVCDNERYGLVHVEATVRHVDVDAHGNADAALWIGSSPNAVIEGAASRIAGNGFAGVVVVDSPGVALRDVRIEATRLVERSFDVFGRSQLGDGVHLMGASTGVTLERVALAGNERAGIVLDVGRGSATFTGVTVDGMGAQLGAIAGMRDATMPELVPGAPAGWDTGITRLGATVSNDAAFTGTLDLVDRSSPATLPVGSELARGVTPCD